MKALLELYLKSWLFQEEVIELPQNKLNTAFEANVQRRERIMLYEAEKFKSLYWRQLQNVDEWILVVCYQSAARPEDISDAEMKEFEKLIEKNQSENSIV